MRARAGERGRSVDGGDALAVDRVHDCRMDAAPPLDRHNRTYGLHN